MIRVLLMVVVARVKVGQSLEVQTRTKLATIASSRVTSRKIVGSGKRSIPMIMRGLRRVLVMAEASYVSDSDDGGVLVATHEYKG